MTLVIWSLPVRAAIVALAAKRKKMTSRVGNWLIAIGAITLFLGLCCLPAAVGEPADPGLLAVGATLFAVGSLVCASGIYAKARILQWQGQAYQAEMANRRSRGGCELCSSDVPVIQCRVHQLQLCATCLAEHFDPRSCSFIPPARRPLSKATRGLARAQGV